MVYTNLKNTAVALRKQGLSYSEIKGRVPVSKSTLSQWFREIKLSPVQRSRLKQKRRDAAKRGAEKKSAKVLETIEEIRKSSGKEIGKISKRELWLLGVMLYWKNGNKADLKKGVHFSSSNPEMVKLFLKWLFDIGGLKKEEISFDLFSGKGGEEDAKNYWSKIANSPHIYLYKRACRKSILRVKVRGSSMLARQINGWIDSLKNWVK